MHQKFTDELLKLKRNLRGGGTYLKGFSPVCVRMWLLRVVAPANARPQYPHLKGLSLECVTT